MTALLRLFPPAFRPVLLVAVTIGLLAGLAPGARAGSGVNTGYFGNVAIKGYDPVAYFTEGKAMKGSGDHVLKWLGAEWHFASDEHKEMFAAKPMSYAPQYGGHCAGGASHNTLTTDIDPEAWGIIDGKLYLNYSKAVADLMSQERIDRADANWDGLKAKAAQ